MTNHITVMSLPCHEFGLSVTWCDMAMARNDEIDVRRGLLTVTFSGKDVGMT